MEYCILFYGVACVCILSVKIYGEEYFRSVDFYFFCTLYYKLYASHTHEIHLYLPTKQSTLKQRSKVVGMFDRYERVQSEATELENSQTTKQEDEEAESSTDLKKKRSVTANARLFAVA